MSAIPLRKTRSHSRQPQSTYHRAGHVLNHFDDIIENASTALLAVDEAGVMVGVSKPAESLLGYAPRQLRGEPAALVLPALNKHPLEALQHGIRTIAVRLGGGLLHQRVTTMRLRVPDFDGWIVLLRSDGGSTHLQ